MNNKKDKWYDWWEMLIFLISVVYAEGIVYKENHTMGIILGIVWFILFYRIIAKKGMWGRLNK